MNSLLPAVLTLQKHLPLELVIKILYYHNGITHPIAFMLKKLRKVAITPHWTQNIYESKVSGWDMVGSSELYTLQLTRGRRGQKNVFKFVKQIYSPLLDMELDGINNEETRGDGYNFWTRHNTNPNVILTPQYQVVEWEYEQGKKVTLNNTPRWEALDDYGIMTKRSMELLFTFD